MARTRNEPVATTVTRDTVDQLVSELNTLDGITWVRDAWENQAPDNYGVVEVNGAPVNMWADNVLISQDFVDGIRYIGDPLNDAYSLRVIRNLVTGLYDYYWGLDDIDCGDDTETNRDDLVALVQAKLAAKCDSYVLAGHEFAYDIGKNHWWWNCQVIGPLQWEDVDTNG